jgi:transposase-like protein
MKTHQTGRRTYKQDYRESCVERALRIGNVAACARELNLSYGVLLSWINKFKGAKDMPKKTTKEQDENRELQQLRKANARLSEEVAILKKATAYFSQKELKRDTIS